MDFIIIIIIIIVVVIVIIYSHTWKHARTEAISYTCVNSIIMPQVTLIITQNLSLIT